MVAIATQPVTAAVGQSSIGLTDSNYDAYQTVAQIVSKNFSEAICKSLEQLSDPDRFGETIRDMARAQGIDAPIMDPRTLFNGFWSLANGLDTDFRWRSSSGIPIRSGLYAKEFVPKQPPTAVSGDGRTDPRFSIGFSAFGMGVGVSW